MRDSYRSSVARGGALAFALAALFSPAAAHAQYIHNDAPPLPIAPAAGMYESPNDKLARNVRILAQQPQNFAALLSAGRASLALGDIESAEGFFGRADDINPRDPSPKVGMAGAAVLNGNLDEAQNWFGQAQRLGASQALLGTDRGLMLDLKGDLGSAQADYRAALGGPDPDEARRRYALSLGMARRTDEGLKIIEPLLRQRDPAALRIRAFVLALGGQKVAAVTAIEQAMPGSGSRIAPFFDTLPLLSVAQKAAAVHLGIFPSEAEIRLAQAQSRSVAPVAAQPQPETRRPARGTSRASTPRPTPPQQVAVNTAPSDTTFRKIERPGSMLYDYVGVNRPAPSTRPVASPPVSAPVVTYNPPAQPVAASSAPQSELPSPGFALSPSDEVAVPVTQSAMAEGDDRLKGIERLLSQTVSEPLPPPPPPPRPRIEKANDASAKSATSSKSSAAAAKRKSDLEAKKAAADAKKKADAEAKALGVPGATWVQLAGGSNAERMATEYKRIKAKKPALFAKRPGYVTQGKDYFRLVVGPFSDSGDARDFVNSLAKAGIDAFMWTRSPPTIHIDKLPSQ